MAMPKTLEPVVQVDWGGDGSFADVTGDVLADPGLTIEQGRDQARSLAPPMVNHASFDLLNEDGTYSQERPSSPVYQLVVPGREVQITATHGTQTRYRSHQPYRAHVPYRGRAPYTLARGVVDTISQETALGGRKVSFSCLGLMGKLRGRVVSVPVHEGLRTDEALTLLLDAVGWPADRRSISPGSTTLLQWWADERDAWDAAVELLNSEGPGALYEGPDGTLHFEGRGYRTLTERATTSQATFFDRAGSGRAQYRAHRPYRAHTPYRGTTSGLYFTAFQYEPGFANIVNRATISTRRRTTGALQTVWEYGAQLVLSANQTRTLIARPNDPFVNAVAPVAGTDYTVSAGSATVTLSYTSGVVAFLTVTAGAGGATLTGVTSTGLQLRAQPLTVVSETVVQNSVDASGSIARFGERTLQVAAWPEIDPNQAESVCNAWVSRYQTQRPQVTITLRNADGDHLRQILERQVSDRITLTEANSGLSADVWIEQKRLTIAGAGGRVVTCTLGCEKVEEVLGSTWDSGLWDAALWGN